MRRLAISLLLCAALPACGGDGAAPAAVTDLAPPPGDPAFQRDPRLNVANISARGLSVSHNMGHNCMTCHQPHGPGKGLFTAAGTAYNPDGTVHPNATVRLRTAPNGGGDLVATIEGDAYGNFYTTQPLPTPEAALFVSITSSDGASTKEMPFPQRSLACNVCHAGGFGVRVR
jgi:hypothetical protein